jgi:hypothetical protein
MLCALHAAQTAEKWCPATRVGYARPWLGAGLEWPSLAWKARAGCHPSTKPPTTRAVLSRIPAPKATHPPVFQMLAFLEAVEPKFGPVVQACNLQVMTHTGHDPHMCSIVVNIDTQLDLTHPSEAAAGLTCIAGLCIPNYPISNTVLNSHIPRYDIRSPMVTYGQPGTGMDACRKVHTGSHEDGRKVTSTEV